MSTGALDCVSLRFGRYRARIRRQANQPAPPATMTTTMTMPAITTIAGPTAIVSNIQSFFTVGSSFCRSFEPQPKLSYGWPSKVLRISEIVSL